MPETDLELKLRDAITEICRKDLSGVTRDTDLVMALGLDSLAGLRMLATLEDRFQVRFPDQRLGEFRTLQQLMDFLVDHTGEST